MKFPPYIVMLLRFTGCYNRAHHFGLKLTEILNAEVGGFKYFETPYKHFMFGEFTRVFPGVGQPELTEWHYHVAPIVALEDAQLYILDPALSDRPMTKKERRSLM